MTTAQIERLPRPLATLARWRERRRAIARGQSHPLAFAKAGRAYRIVGVLGQHRFHFDPIFENQHTPEHSLLQRLLEMGLVPGTRVEIKRAGDPVTIALWGGRTALSAPLAHAVFVEAA